MLIIIIVDVVVIIRIMFYNVEGESSHQCRCGVEGGLLS